MIELSPEDIHIRPIGYVERLSSGENVKDRDVVSKILIKRALNEALDGIEDFSHIFVIFWMHKISDTQKMLVHPGKPPVGVFATRAPIRPNPIGLTLVELVKHKENVLWVKGLDAYDGTPVLDIKPYPDWKHGRLIVITDFEVPTWLAKITK